MSEDYEIATWFNKETFKEVFGIKVRKDGKWYNAALDGEAIFCETKAQAKVKIAELMALNKGQGE